MRRSAAMASTDKIASCRVDRLRAKITPAPMTDANAKTIPPTTSSETIIVESAIRVPTQNTTATPAITYIMWLKRQGVD